MAQLTQLVSPEGFVDAKTGKRVIDKKTGNEKELPDPEYILFEKCVRGDPTDNVFSAYPGARVKGTKNKTGIKEAYEDRNSTGFNYNNFMLQRWWNHNGDEQRVRDCFERNRILIDPTAQPDEIKELIRERIPQQKQVEQMKNVGIHFMKSVLSGVHNV